MSIVYWRCYNAELHLGQNPGEADEHADEHPRDGFWHFVNKWFGCARPVSSVVRVAGLRPSSRWKCRMRWSWAVEVTHGLRLWGRMDLLRNSLKRRLKGLMVENWTVYFCVTAAHFRGAFYCPQHKVHLCNDHTVKLASWYATPVRWMDYLGKCEMLTNRVVKKCVHNLREIIDHFWDLLFQLMNSTLHMLCLYFLFSLDMTSIIR